MTLMVLWAGLCRSVCLCEFPPCSLCCELNDAGQPPALPHFLYGGWLCYNIQYLFVQHGCRILSFTKECIYSHIIEEWVKMVFIGA